VLLVVLEDVVSAEDSSREICLNPFEKRHELFFIANLIGLGENLFVEQNQLVVVTLNLDVLQQLKLDREGFELVGSKSRVEFGQHLDVFKRIVDEPQCHLPGTLTADQHRVNVRLSQLLHDQLL